LGLDFYAIQVAATKAPGGIETAMREYAQMFRAVGVASLILYRGPAKPFLAKSGMEVFNLPSALVRPVGRLPFVGMRLQREIRQRIGDRVPLIIVHSDRALPVLRKMFPGAVVAAPCHSDKTKGKLLADLIITLNDAQHALAVDALAGSRARAVKLGNPFSCSANRARTGERSRVVFCARFTETKDPLSVIRATSLMAGKPELLMIGDGRLMDLARAEAGPNVRFAGWLTDPWMEIRCTDVLVLPSSWEGLPYLLLEALDRAVPVIASDIPGNRAALGDGEFGELVPLGNTAALARALDVALDQPQKLRDKAEAGRQSLAARFGPVAFWEKLSKAAAEAGRTQ